MLWVGSVQESSWNTISCFSSLDLMTSLDPVWSSVLTWFIIGRTYGAISEKTKMLTCSVNCSSKSGRMGILSMASEMFLIRLSWNSRMG